MTITIQLDNPLVVLLREQAGALNLTPEELGRHLLGGAIAQFGSSADWQQRNRRRGQLIDKKFHGGGLTTDESEELGRLDAEMEYRLAPLDQKRLDWLRELEDRVRKQLAP